MSIPTARAVKIGVVTALLGAALIGATTTALNTIVPRAEYDLHVQDALTRDKQQMDLLLDILCSNTIRPEDRRCR